MISKEVRNLATAFLLGTAMIGAAAIPAATSAYAAGVRPAVGNALKEAEQLAASGKYSAAMDKVREAEGVANKTAQESSAIEQVKNYVSAQSGDTSTAVGTKTKFAHDYSAGRYSDVIGPDAEALRKFGALDGDAMRVIAQAYYLSGQKQECVRYIQNNFGSGAGEGVLQLQMRCAYDTGDDVAERDALENLVGRTGKPEYWNQLLKASERAKGLNDHNTLDIYRLKYLTGSMAGGDDYLLLSQLALQFHFPGEALSYVQKGFATKALSGDRATRLQNLAKQQADADAAGFAKAMAAAQAAKTGDQLVTLGEDLWGNGKYPDAIKAIEAGIGKGVTDQDNAQIRLGMAYLGAGQKDAAIRAFSKARANQNEQLIAHLWSLYARK